eukprot:344372_1
MAFAENPNKIRNIVSGQFEDLDAMYINLYDKFTTTINGKLCAVRRNYSNGSYLCPSALDNLLSISLKKVLRQNVEFDGGSASKMPPEERHERLFLDKGGFSESLRNDITRKLTQIVRRSSLSQTLKAALTARPSHALTYTMGKLSKARNKSAS